MHVDDADLKTLIDLVRQLNAIVDSFGGVVKSLQLRVSRLEDKIGGIDASA